MHSYNNLEQLNNSYQKKSHTCSPVTVLPVRTRAQSGAYYRGQAPPHCSKNRNCADGCVPQGLFPFCSHPHLILSSRFVPLCYTLFLSGSRTGSATVKATSKPLYDAQPRWALAERWSSSWVAGRSMTRYVVHELCYLSPKLT